MWYRYTLTDHAGLEVDEHGARHVFAGARLGEEGVEAVVAAADRFVRGHLAVRLDAVLEAVQLPAGVAHLATGLAEVDRDTFPLWPDGGESVSYESSTAVNIGIGGFSEFPFKCLPICYNALSILFIAHFT